MAGSLNDILPEPISEENERILRDHLKRKMKGASGLAVRLLHAMEERFGPEAREVVRDMARDLQVTLGQGGGKRQDGGERPDAGDPESDLQEFCAQLDRGCAGSHEWERVVDEPDRIGYHYTRCMWAEVYRELGEPELGFVICAGDELAVKSHNPDLGFKRTQVLMNGDPVCDHVFYVDRGE
jgi:hypothetical protein